MVPDGQIIDGSLMDKIKERINEKTKSRGNDARIKIIYLPI